ERVMPTSLRRSGLNPHCVFYVGSKTTVRIRLREIRRYAPRRAVKQSAPLDPLTRSLPVRGGATDEVVGETEPMETLLKKSEIKRDPEGRFERHGKALSKTQKKKKPSIAPRINKGEIIAAPNKGRGRPKGSLNKVTLALKEAILAAAEGAHEDGMVG